MPQNRSEAQVGRLAVERELITEEQLAEALQEHNVRRMAGSRLPFGEVLVELGLLTRAQLEGLLDAQGGKKAPRQQIPGFELIRKLGEGGMGATYLARQTSLDRLVALKVLRANLSRNQSFAARFRREAQLAGKLDHVNIVQAIDVGESAGFHFLVMEYVEGRNLTDLIPEKGMMAEDLALQLIVQVARGLQHAHEHGIIHRDVKPDNVLVTADHIAKLCDFGLAKQTDSDSSLTQTGTAMGTPHYISPEQARGESNVDIRSDIYSLGATLYRLVTGQTPFQGTTAAVVMTKHLSEQIPWPRDINPDLSEGCAQIIAKAMTKDPAERYATPAEMIKDLELVADGKPPIKARVGVAGSSVGGRGTVPVRNRKTRERKPYRATRLHSPVEETESGAPRVLGLPLPVAIGIGAAALLLLVLGVWALTREGEARIPDPALVAEGAAREEWQASVQGLIKKELTAEEGKALGAALAGFAGRHASTTFAASRSGEIARLTSLAGEAVAAGADKNIRDMLSYAEKYWREHPGDYQTARAKFQMVLKNAGGTVYHMQAEDAIRTIDQARQKASRAAFAALRSKTSSLASTGDYDAALALLAKKPSEMADLLRPLAEKEAARLRAEVEKKLGAALGKAEQLSRDGEPEKGLAELAGAAALKYTPWAKRITRLRVRLEKENRNFAELQRKRREAAARKRLDGILTGIEALLLTGKVAEAKKKLASETAQMPVEERTIIGPELKSMGEVITAISRARAAHKQALADLVGKQITIKDKEGTAHTCKLRGIDGKKRVIELAREYSIMGQVKIREYSLSFDDLASGELARLVKLPAPQSPAEHLGAAFVAASVGNLSGAAAGIRAATGHPLAPRYARKLEVVMMNVAEAMARRFWRNRILAAVKEKPSAAEAKALATALETFLKKHGRSKFAGKRKAKVARLMALAGKAIAGSPEVMLARVQQLFRGKVVRFDPRTARIELFYDFSDPGQLDDWRLSTWGRGTVAPRIEKQRLCMPGLNRYVYLDAFFTSATVRAGFDASRKSGGGFVTMLAAADGGGNFYGLFSLSAWKSTALIKCIKGGERELVPRRPSPCAGPKIGAMSLQVEAGRITGYVGKMNISAEDRSLSGGYVGLAAMGTDVSWDNVRVIGKLDRAWLNRRLKEPLPAFRAAWQPVAIKGKSPAPRSEIARGMIYDSRRKRCVLWGGHWTHWNDMWALDLATSAWTCLQTNDPKGPAVAAKTRPPGMGSAYLAYDPGSDIYWLTNQWAYSPGAGTWKQHSARLTGLGRLPYGPWLRAALAYDPGGKRFLWWKGSGAFVVPGTDQCQKISRGPPARSYPDGGLVYDRKHKVFVLFGGATHKGPRFNDTWIFDPRKNVWRQISPPRRPRPREFHKLLWHRGLGAIVMVGGMLGAKHPISDLWVFETAAEKWIQVRTGLNNPAGGATAYDAARDAVVLFGIDGKTWTLKMQRIGKVARAAPLPKSPWVGVWREMKAARKVAHPGAADFDTKRSAYLLAGGKFEVWAYRLRDDKWFQLSKPAPGDGTRFPKDIGNCPAGIAYDPVKDGLVFASGNNGPRPGTGGAVFFDMSTRKWRLLNNEGSIAPALARGGEHFLRYTGGKLCNLDWTTGKWRQLKCKLPPSRSFPQKGLVYDAPRKRFFMFAGGYGAKRNDTWTFDPEKNLWREIKTRVRPTFRSYSSLCHDIVNDAVVMHGGSRMTDTWVFDPRQNDWCPLPVNAPPGNSLAWLSYDPLNKCCLAYDPKAGRVWTLRLTRRR
jgi:eukaryotic-like serine/threonine-protein kinase